MSKKDNTIAIGTSPFIYSYLKIKKIEATVYDNNNMDFPQLSAARARFIHCVWCRREKDFFCVFWRNF